MVEEEINKMLKLGPKDAQGVEKVVENKFVIFKKEIMESGSAVDLFLFYNLNTKQQSDWFKVKTKEYLGSGIWLLKSTGGAQCFYNLSINQASDWFKVKTKEDLGHGIWLLVWTDSEKNFYNANTNKLSDSLVFKSHKIEGVNILCFSSYETFAVFDLETMSLGHFQMN